MTDPNITFKRDWFALAEKLGRQPRVSDPEWRQLHENYKDAFRSKPAEETVLPPTCRICGRTIGATNNDGTCADCAMDTESAPQARSEGFSRQPAPQAHAIDAREAGTQKEAERIARFVRREESEPLSGPDKSDQGQGAERVLPVGTGPSRIDEGPTGDLNGYQASDEGRRGVGGGVIARCVRCDRLWERPARRGRPAVKCPECS